MTATYGPSADSRVKRAVMVHRWERLTFMHWSYDPAEVQRLLPEGLTVQTFEDRGWVGLVPFHLVVRLPGLPSIPWVSRFPETNVRTYVIDRTGRTGIWFFSLDADRFGAVAVARTTYRLPYFWGAMTLKLHHDVVAYSSRRYWPGPYGAGCNASIRIGDAYAPGELTEFDHYLTARWTLFSSHTRGLHYADAFHDPWPLHRAEVVDLEDSLVAAAGLSAPEGRPVTHYSPAVEVDIGMPHRLRSDKPQR